MSKTLEEALTSVELKAGTTYTCEVNGLPIRLEVGARKPTPEPMDLEADTMLDPWVDLPQPEPVLYGKGRIVAAELPDPPPFTPDEDDS